MKISYSIATLKRLFIAGVFLIFASCGTNSENATPAQEETVKEEIAPVPTGDKSQTSVDYPGTYKGITPCADCEGIEVELIINQDSTFSLSNKYLGKGDGKPFVKTGRYSWTADGSTIELEGITDGPSKFKVGENRVWMLDMQGNKVEGALADKYILTKQ
jgi:uncharacterized lipoprotein NlpE involved in copper resistance